MDLTEERWRRLEELFHAALELPMEARSVFIDRETSTDAGMRAELIAMLRHADGAGARIAQTVNRVARQAAAGDDWKGRRVGPYRIVREVGRGGMGIVFEARRDDDEYDKTVALKLAPDWRDPEKLRERFRNERQILARLEHPNIARFLDGGTDRGIPYFAMEFISGKPITEWARERDLCLRDRIALFRQICAAVQYAHENLVVHRDLKPGNILVDQNDTPKLLDFGIASLLSPIAEETAATTGIRLWTPDYASPEQVRAGQVTVRTDVYSLGLVLYELVCGERAQVADTSTPLALDHSICEAAPVLPSVRAATCGRKTLSRQLQGDLDTIVAMAIRKEPDRRYASASALDSDLARYLDGRAVEARPSTATYRFWKLIRRNRWRAIAVAVVIATLCGGVGSTIYEARRAQRRFDQVRSLANTFVFDVHDRIQNLPGSTQARKTIVATALRYLESLSQEAGNDAALRKELAAAYERIGDVQGNPDVSNLGDSQGALQSYRRSAGLLEALAARGDYAAKLALASTLYKLGTLQHVLGDPAALAALERPRKLARELIKERPTDMAALTLAGNINSSLTRFAADARSPRQAREAAEEAADIARRMVTIEPSSQASLDFLALSQNTLASAYRSAGDLERSVQSYRAALEIRQRLVNEHPDNAMYRRLLLITYGHLGDALGPPEARGLGELPESVEAFTKAAEIAQWLSDRDPSDRQSRFDVAVANCRVAASLLEENGRAAEALLALGKAASILAQLRKEDPSNQRYLLYDLVIDVHTGKALAALGRNFEAAQRFEQARSIVKQFRGGPNEGNARMWGIGASLRLADLKTKEGDRAATALVDQIAVDMVNVRTPLFNGQWSEASLCARLGALYLRLEKVKPATVWLERSAQLWRRMTVPASLEGQRKKALAAVERDLSSVHGGPHFP